MDIQFIIFYLNTKSSTETEKLISNNNLNCIDLMIITYILKEIYKPIFMWTEYTCFYFNLISFPLPSYPNKYLRRNYLFKLRYEGSNIHLPNILKQLLLLNV